MAMRKRRPRRRGNDPVIAPSGLPARLIEQFERVQASNR